MQKDLKQNEVQKKGKLITRKRREWIWALLFIGPTVLGVYLFTIGPIFYAFYVSLTRWSGLTPPVFIGFDNYVRMFSDPFILSEIRNTLIFVVVGVPLTISISLLIAIMLCVKIPALGFFRTTIFIPWVTLPIAAAMVFQNIFNVRFGMVNGFLRMMGIPVVDWLGNIPSVMGIIIGMGVWGSIGYYSVILMVGIKNLPTSYFEAARIDGATRRQTFFRITIPLLTPQLFFVTTMAMIGSFGIFEPVLIFGGNVMIRDGIRTLAYGIFERGFEMQSLGYAAANATLLFVLIMIVTIFQFIGQRYWVHYE